MPVSKQPVRYAPGWTEAIEEDIVGLIDSRNGWTEPGQLTKEMQDEVNFQIAEFQFSVLQYLTNNVALHTEAGMKTFVTRVATFVWVLSPGLITTADKKAATLEELGEMLPGKPSKSWVCQVAKHISETFGFFSRNQRPFSRENYIKAGQAGWDTRRKTDMRRRKPRADKDKSQADKPRN